MTHSGEKSHNTHFVVPEEAIRAQGTMEGVDSYSTGIAVFHSGRILLLRRVPSDFLGGHFELPGGGVDLDESLSDGATRELLEETGLYVSAFIGIFDGFDYEHRGATVRQVNLAAEVQDGAPRLNPHEHDAWLLVSSDEVAGLTMTHESRQSALLALELYGQPS